eukprot:scaffold219883_cov15-Tisochrysis_lutea.AAC.1
MDAFDLHPYDNLLPQEEYERQYEVARKTVREKKVRNGEQGCARGGVRWRRKVCRRKSCGPVIQWQCGVPFKKGRARALLAPSCPFSYRKDRLWWDLCKPDRPSAA